MWRLLPIVNMLTLPGNTEMEKRNGIAGLNETCAPVCITGASVQAYVGRDIGAMGGYVNRCSFPIYTLGG